MQQFRPSRFEILPPVIKNLIIINGLMFLAQVTIKNTPWGSMYDLFALHTWQSELFKPWQFVTHMFMHGDFGHLFFNMIALWMFGSVLENVWSEKRFLIFYFICGLGAALSHMIVLHFENEEMIRHFNAIQDMNDAQYFFDKYNVSQYSRTAKDALLSRLDMPTVGASGAVYGCLAAFGYLFPNTYIYFMLMIPLKAKWLVTIYIVGELMATFKHSAGDNIAHIAHLGGALFGFLMVYTWNKRNRRTFY